ncbi:transporter substrate-binding domain-containing protein [Pseudomonas sp. MM211]|uniref:substrate-binding periplasmic protein n=1 Tax=Pseudomonas sp. MM211 TaxID=2866808 RepID=UPI001CEDDC6C|nr:transporter substrate-binding domain-containing protein [Pseudomonas sp. MM211]UCJ15554.1 transporter substrate-binding domain-containing protein [Pseudomonas sp. MM211]
MLRLIACLLPLLLPCSLAAEQRDIQLYMPDAAPLALHSDNGNGITGDAAIMALQRAGYNPVIENVPWPRAQKRTQESRDVMIVPLSRTPAREEHFTWVANIQPLYRAFFTLDNPVASLEEARQRYRLVAVGLGSAQEELLRRNGFTGDQLYVLKLGDRPIQLVRRGRVDAWFTTELEGRHQWDSGPELAMSAQLAPLDMYIACSLQCDQQLVRSVHDALESMRSDGSLQRITERYAPNR